MKKDFVGRKKKAKWKKKKEKRTEVKGGKKWEHVELIWEFEIKENYLNKD